MRDEAEIRGHRRTYIGAMPGVIIRALRDAGSNNPLFMIDEIDKMGADYRGDPASAMLEVLDPEQNASFRDHYLDMPFDLSRVMFITTANTLDTVPGPLRDRMEVIQLAGYTEEEKLQIARRYLVPRQIERNGLKKSQIALHATPGLRAIIADYTREAGVRKLEREIGAACRKVARQVAEGNAEAQGLGDRAARARAARPRRASRVDVVKRAHARARGGDRPGLDAGRRRRAVRRGDRDAGQPGAPAAPDRHRPARRRDARVGAGRAVLRPRARPRARARAARPTSSPRTTSTCTCRRARSPKDGPSAGITMATALISLVTGRPVRSDTAMTGEITLTGQVLPIGGLKEKALAAQRVGIKRVIAPKRNEPDLEDIPEPLRKGLEFEWVEAVGEVFEAALEPARNGRRTSKGPVGGMLARELRT